MLRSARHAYLGLREAMRTERNLQIFAFWYVAVLLLGIYLQLVWIEWIVILFAGGIFLSVELLNTALEWISDAFDDHLKAGHQSEDFLAVKMAKDVAAGASLVSLIMVIVILTIIFVPYLSPLAASVS